MFELSGTLRFHSFARRLITHLLICGTVILGDPCRLKSVRCFDCVVCFVTLQLLLWTNEFFFGFEDCRCLWKSVFITEKWSFLLEAIFEILTWHKWPFLPISGSSELSCFSPPMQLFIFLSQMWIASDIVLIIFNNVFWLMLYSFLSLSFSPLCFWSN